MPPSPKKSLPPPVSEIYIERQPPLPVHLSLHTDEGTCIIEYYCAQPLFVFVFVFVSFAHVVSTPEAVHNISHSVHLASRHHHHRQQQQQQLSSSKQLHTSKLRAPQVKPGKAHTLFHLPRTGDLSIFSDGSPSSPAPAHTAGPILSSTVTPVSVRTAPALSSSKNVRDKLASSVHGHKPRMVDDSPKMKPRPPKSKIPKSSVRDPKPPLSASGTGSSKKSPSHIHKTKSNLQTSKYQSSPLVVRHVTAATGLGRGKAAATGLQEDKENTTPLLMAMPKAHDILADQVSRVYSFHYRLLPF